MIAIKEWTCKHEWRRQGVNFHITVEHRPEEGSYGRLGPNRWCVYAYIYPKHSAFPTIAPDDFWQGSLDSFPFHGGCTYIRHHRDGDEPVCSIQVGADYMHCDDDHFTYFDTPERARQVFEDAERLFAHLSNAAQI